MNLCKASRFFKIYCSPNSFKYNDYLNMRIQTSQCLINCSVCSKQ